MFGPRISKGVLKKCSPLGVSSTLVEGNCMVSRVEKLKRRAIALHGVASSFDVCKKEKKSNQSNESDTVSIYPPSDSRG